MIIIIIQRYFQRFIQFQSIHRIFIFKKNLNRFNQIDKKLKIDKKKDKCDKMESLSNIW